MQNDEFAFRKFKLITEGVQGKNYLTNLYGWIDHIANKDVGTRILNPILAIYQKTAGSSVGQSLRNGNSIEL